MGRASIIFALSLTVCRSTDAGRAFVNLTVTAPLVGKNDRDGPHEVAAIRVHPRTRAAWANGQCYGMWRIAAPPASGGKAAPPPTR